MNWKRAIKIVGIILLLLIALYSYGNALSQKDLLEDERDYYKQTMLYFCGAAKLQSSIIKLNNLDFGNYEALEKPCEDWVVDN